MLQSQLMKTAKNRKKLQASKRASGQVADRSAELLRLEKSKRIADEVKLYLEDKNITRPKFEEMVSRSQSTMNHFFAGKFSEKLLTRVEHVLKRKFGQSSSVAPPEWGGYTQEATAKLVGSYLTLRNDFKNVLQICAYVTTIEWGNIEDAHTFDGQLVRKPKVDGFGLVFREERRVDSKYTHRGQVWIPGGQFLYLVSAYGDGRLRAAISSVPDNGKMTGIQLSQFNPKGAAYTPAAAPIAFIQRERITDEEIGYFLPGQPHYDDYRQLLIEAMGDVVIAFPT